jgi:glycosyltransferase involved in cell wall biosynthesis
VAQDVAVVVAAFNAAETIDASLASVRAQTLQPAEVIVIDDGSVDATADLAEAWADRLPLRIVRLSANQGLAAARREAIATTTSPLIALLDADDALFPDHLQVLVAAYGGEGTIVSGDGVRWEPGRGALTPFYRELVPVPPIDRQRTEVLRRDFVFVGCLFDRVSYDRAGGYRAEVPAAENWDLWLRMLRGGAVVVTAPGPTYLYRVSAGSLSRSRRGYEGEVFVLEQALREATTTRERRRLRRTLGVHRARLRLFDAYDSARAGDTVQARLLAVRALHGEWPVRVRAAAVAVLPARATVARDRRDGE